MQRNRSRAAFAVALACAFGASLQAAAKASPLYRTAAKPGSKPAKRR